MTGQQTAWTPEIAKNANLVKSLFLDAEQLEEHNLVLKAKYDRMKQEEVRYEPYNMIRTIGRLLSAMAP